MVKRKNGEGCLDLGHYTWSIFDAISLVGVGGEILMIGVGFDRAGAVFAKVRPSVASLLDFPEDLP